MHMVGLLANVHSIWLVPQTTTVPSVRLACMFSNFRDHPGSNFIHVFGVDWAWLS